MVRFWAIRLGLLAGVVGLLGSFSVQLLAFWWQGLAQYTAGLLVFNLSLLGIVGLALALVIAPGGRVAAPAVDAEMRAWHRRLDAPAPIRWTGAGLLRRLVREWPLLVLGGLFLHLLLNLVLGNQAAADTYAGQLYLLRVQSTSWMILYFVPVAVVGSYVIRRK